MVPRLAGVLALLFAATVLFAQDGKKVRIEFAGEGAREVWIQDKGKLSELPERTSASGKAIEIDVPTDTKDKLVFVHDVQTGDVATKSLDQMVRAGKWTVTESDNTHTYVVAFLVGHGGEPVSAALVKMKAGNDERQTLLTAEDKGIAAFFVVPYGDVAVTVEYESEGEDKALAEQVFETKPGMAEAGPFVLTIDDEVATVKAEEPEKEQEEGAAKKDDEKKEEEPVRTNPFSTILNMLIGLAVIGGISYGIWRYVKANPDKTADALQKAGVHVPGDAGAVAAPKKTGPPQQILLGDAAPTPVAPIAPAGPVVKNPRLVKADGSLYIVQDGEQTVGREGGQLTLAGESSVSRNHARLSRTGDAVTVEDTGSTNGTFVNGRRISGPTTLNPGDTVQFGAVQYRYEE